MGDSWAIRTSKNLASGTMGGIAVTLVGHPFDTLKVRLQTQPVHNPVYKGLADCFMKTIKWEGVGGLYKGVGSPLAGQMFFRATLFTSYFQFCQIQANPDNPTARMSWEKYFIAGAGTGAVSSLLESPIDLFKTKMQIQIIQAKSGAKIENPYRNVFHAGYVISKSHGVRGAYQGLSATLMRNIPSFGLAFGFYEIARDLQTPEGGDVKNLGIGQLLIAGAVCGVTYWVLTYPTDVVKSAMQSDNSVKSQRKFHGWLDCVRTLYQKEGGIKRFYRGYSPCMMRSVVANAAQLMCMEKTRQLLKSAT